MRAHQRSFCQDLELFEAYSWLVYGFDIGAGAKLLRGFGSLLPMVSPAFALANLCSYQVVELFFQCHSISTAFYTHANLNFSRQSLRHFKALEPPERWGCPVKPKNFVGFMKLHEQRSLSVYPQWNHAHIIHSIDRRRSARNRWASIRQFGKNHSMFLQDRPFEMLTTSWMPEPQRV